MRARSLVTLAALAGATLASSGHVAPPLGALLAPVVHAAQATARIASITTQPTNGDLRVVIKGTAPLTPKSVEEAKDPPARLVLDFADVASDVP